MTNTTNPNMYGSRQIPIDIAERHYAWEFIIAGVQTPLLGVDFLAHRGHLVDNGNRRLLDIETYQTMPFKP